MKYVKWIAALTVAVGLMYGIAWFIGYISYQLTHMM